AAVLLALVVLYPIARTTFLGFTRTNMSTGFHSQFVGAQNYVHLTADSRFHNALWVTTNFTVISVTLEFIFGLLLALAADSFVRGRGLIRAIFLAPWTLPTAVIAVLWAWIFNDQYGVLNAMLVKGHIVRAPVAWLATPASAMASIIVADVWKTIPFVFLVLLAGIQNVPRDLYEAVEIDGGGAWAKFRHVTWPFLLPFVFISLIFRLIQAFAIFDLVYVMTGGGPGGSTETVSVYAYQTYMRYLDIGYGSAQVGAVVIILAAAAYVLYRLLWRQYAPLV
ncbi:MAG: carbohydrate ABC transporter permease, partial [Candidatus Acidiferrales bacterium]